MTHLKSGLPKATLVLMASLLCCISIYAQDIERSFWERTRIGGGLGLSFGDGFFSGTLTPSIIYEIEAPLAIGVGLNGTYNSLRDQYRSTIVGGSLIALYNIIPQVQLSTEFEQLRVQRRYASEILIPNETYWYPALFLGVGWHQQNVTVGIRYDVLYNNDKSIYAAAYLPFVRVYF